MESYILDVLSLLLRWFHIVAGIAWIGTSFYFILLDNSLKPFAKVKDNEDGASGELWAVHGGGVYHSQKFPLGPTNQPLSQNLHWSKWEAYSTWLSGISLIIVIYWYQAKIYLIDANVMALQQTTAIVISICFLLGGWLIYNVLCKLIHNDKILSFAIFIVMSVVAWGLCQLYSGRAAYIIFGSMLGTIMVANVFFVIIPNQKTMVAAIKANKIVSPILAQKGRLRSVHNTYFTLPLIFTMLSNHYYIAYGSKYNWLVLIAISLAGAFIRVFFISRHSKKPLYLVLVIAIALLTATFVTIFLQSTTRKSLAQAEFSQVYSIIHSRCVACHSKNPNQVGFVSAPKGVMYDSKAQIKAQAASIYKQVVATKAMPIGNITKMTVTERELVGDWVLSYLKQQK